MNRKKILLPVLLLCLMLVLGGCRVRTTGNREGIIPDDGGSTADEARQGETLYAEAELSDSGDDGDSCEPGTRTRENPEAGRKEYDENAPAEIVPGTDRMLHGDGEGSGASAVNGESDARVSRLNDRAEETAVQTVAAKVAEDMGVSEDGDEADSAMTYFTVLLQDRAGSLFECQRMNVYWETIRDHVTIHKSSPEHTLILNTGCYDVSSRLLPENLTVDDGWVTRKNPGVIVRIVDRNVLGSRVSADREAGSVADSLRHRDGWAGIDAVKNHRMLLLSEEMLEAPYLQTAAMVLIAMTAYPELYADVDPDQMLQMLAEEATGTLPTGMYYYRDKS